MVSFCHNWPAYHSVNHTAHNAGAMAGRVRLAGCFQWWGSDGERECLQAPARTGRDLGSGAV
jgi:hypothetical protein